MAKPVIPTPPGYENQKLPRTVRPDMGKIEALRRQRGLTKQQFAERCLKGDAGIFRHWEKGGGCHKGSLVRVATQFDLQNWWTLWADYVAPLPAPAITVMSSDERLFEQLCFNTIVSASPGYLSGRSAIVKDFLSLVMKLYPDELAELSGKSHVIARGLAEFERMGWLVKTSQGVYELRYWTESECHAAIHQRLFAETGAMYSLAMLRNKKQGRTGWDQLTFDKTVHQQMQRLNRLKDLHQRVSVRDEAAEAVALEIISEDQDFHMGWRFVPTVTLPLMAALKGIDQCTNRFVETLKRCRERGIEVPPGFPSLASLVAEYYPQLEVIFTAFMNVRPESFTGMAEVFDALQKHAYAGFNTVIGAEKLIERFPRRLAH